MSALDLTSWVARLDAPHAGLALVGASGERTIAGEAGRPFALASVTKLLSAYAVLVASEECTISLEDEAGPPGATVAHLLAHASGLGPSGSQPLALPGTRRIYSNAGYEALAGHLEKASGIAFADYLHQSVFEPLGMTASRLTGSAAYGVTSSVIDLVAFATELLSPQLIAPETLARSTAVAFPGLSGVLPGFGFQDPCDWGLGFELVDHKSPHWSGSRRSSASFGHFGQSGTFLLVDPVSEAVVIELTDRPFGEWAAEIWPSLIDDALAQR